MDTLCYFWVSGLKWKCWVKANGLVGHLPCSSARVWEASTGKKKSKQLALRRKTLKMQAVCISCIWKTPVVLLVLPTLHLHKHKDTGRGATSAWQSSPNRVVSSKTRGKKQRETTRSQASDEKQPAMGLKSFSVSSVFFYKTRDWRICLQTIQLSFITHTRWWNYITFQQNSISNTLQLNYSPKTAQKKNCCILCLGL